jgi:hypothetical protein
MPLLPPFRADEELQDGIIHEWQPVTDLPFIVTGWINTD